MENKETYTKEEVLDLLTAYRLSDSGTFTIEEAKIKWPSSYEGTKSGIRKWFDDIAFKPIEERAKKWSERMGEGFMSSFKIKKHYKDKTRTEIYIQEFVKR